MTKQISMYVMVFIYLCAPFKVTAQYVKSEHVTFAGLELYSNEVKKSVFSILKKGNLENINIKDDWISLGTGFLIMKDIGEQVVGITCAHVIKQHSSVQLYAGLDSDQGFLKLPFKVIYQNDEDDIAVIIPQSPKPQPYNISTLSFLSKDIADNDLIIEGKGIIIPGYPLGLGIDEEISHPVVRFGIIAQFRGSSTFLFDGFASHGNSGSPVYSLKDKKLIGMVSSFVTDHINLYDENGVLTAKLPYNSGLGRAISSAKILEVINNLEF